VGAFPSLLGDVPCDPSQPRGNLEPEAIAFLFFGSMTPSLLIQDFTDPGCPWAFSAEPQRWRLRWLFGDEIEWRPRMVVLSETSAENEAKDFTSEMLAGGIRSLQRRYGMPIDSQERSRVPVTMPSCRAVVAVRLHAPEHEQAVLRRLRVLYMGGGLLDDEALIRQAAEQAGIDGGDLMRWSAEPEVEDALREDMAAARHPSPAALALDHKLAGWGENGGRRYTCPSYEIERIADGSRLDVPGFQPIESYEAAVANLAPDLPRREDPDTVAEVLTWAGEPLATAEVVGITGLDETRAREQLAAVAAFDPVGADGYWTLRAT